MQVPERLALIGGSILLASTLVFTLKSQASKIIPKVSSSLSNIYDRINDNGFTDGYQKAQKDGWQTGDWGTAKYYIDDQNNMHVGQGNLSGSIYSALGSEALQVRSLSLDGNVKAPEDSSFLLSYSSGAYVSNEKNNLSNIDNLNRLDTSGVKNMHGMFANDDLVPSLDLSDWHVSNVTDMGLMFHNTASLANLDVKGWDVSQVTNMGGMFSNNNSLTKLDLSSFRTDNLQDMGYMFDDSSNLASLNISNFDTSNVANMNATFVDLPSFKELTLGDKTHLRLGTDINDGEWSSNDGNATPNLQDDQSHPGTWIRR